MKRKQISVWLVLFFLAMVGCSSPTGATPQTTLTVFAASSLADAFTEIGKAFEAQQAGVQVIFNFAGSSDLATQLAEGASADLFASANPKQMGNAIAANRIAGEPVHFLTNRLVVIVPADNPVGIKTVADLAQEGVKFVSAQPGVPIRDFTEEMLNKASAEYGVDFKTAVLSNLVSEEANVRQLAAKVALGEADAGVVYQSDVTPDIADKIQVIEIPDDINVTAVYPIAIVQDSPHPELAQAFIAFLLSQEGQTILAKWGFGWISEQ